MEERKPLLFSGGNLATLKNRMKNRIVSNELRNVVKISRQH